MTRTMSMLTRGHFEPLNDAPDLIAVALAVLVLLGLPVVAVWLGSGGLG
jgi:hypothetical protein